MNNVPNSRKTKSFFEDPVALTLAPFAEFSFSKVSSWSEVELYATVAGVEVDSNFLNVMCAASYYFPGLYDALSGELKSRNGFIDGLANSLQFVECLLKVWTPLAAKGIPFSARPQFEVGKWLSENGYYMDHFFVNDRDMESLKFKLLAALDSRFPYLLVKFYALHSADLRRDDMQFVSWLTHRLEKRVQTDVKLIPVLDAMRRDAVEKDRTAMYMR